MQTRPFACNGVVCCDYKHIDHIQPHNNFPAQSLHFRFGSVAPCPTLKSNVTASTPRTRYGQMASPYPTRFSCYIQSAYKSKQSFLRSLEEISYADFSARTICPIITYTFLLSKIAFQNIINKYYQKLFDYTELFTSFFGHLLCIKYLTDEIFHTHCV